MNVFGTDGVRGVANIDLTPELCLRMGLAAGTFFREGGARTAVVGRDTRRSGPMLGAALASGICAAGIDVTTIGVAPTPAISHAARTGGFGFAAVVSASHNPAEDNGVKLLGADGGKVPTEDEAKISLLFDDAARAVGPEIGSLHPNECLGESYLEYLAATVDVDVAGFRLAVDCSNGAATEYAPRLFERLGCTVVRTGCEPDGDNINHGVGATHPSVVQSLTTSSGANLGVSFDGDADRCVFSDEKGRLVNGDRVMAHWAIAAGESLSPRVVVGTVMSNLGFEQALNDAGIALERTPVGDRHVAERMKQTGARVGGEQSGHIIFGDYAPTGDGLLTALQLLKVLKASGGPASRLAPEFANWPQVMYNVRVADMRGWSTCEAVQESIAVASANLGGSGRVVVRASGTQPMVRVMVEARDEGLRDEQAEAIVSAIERNAGGTRQSRVDLTNALGD